MQQIKEHTGKLSEQELLELDDLIYELQKLNNGPIPDRQQVKSVTPLPEPKNTKLWEYILHMIKLTILLPDNLKSISKLAESDPYNDASDYLSDLPVQLAPFVLKYVWRKWKHRNVSKDTGIVDCGYVITTAKFALCDWKSSLKSIKGLVPIDEELDISRSKTGKVSNKNLDWKK